MKARSVARLAAVAPVLVLLSPSLAALTGDREGAIRAYRHYLALRSDPEPARAPETDRVRAALARLTAGGESP